MDVFPICPLYVQFLGQLEVGVLQWFHKIRYYLHGEGTKLLKVNSLVLNELQYLSIHHLLSNVLCSGLKHYMELRNITTQLLMPWVLVVYMRKQSLVMTLDVFLGNFWDAVKSYTDRNARYQL